MQSLVFVFSPHLFGSAALSVFGNPPLLNWSHVFFYSPGPQWAYRVERSKECHGPVACLGGPFSGDTFRLKSFLLLLVHQAI